MKYLHIQVYDPEKYYWVWANAMLPPHGVRFGTIQLDGITHLFFIDDKPDVDTQRDLHERGKGFK